MHTVGNGTHRAQIACATKPPMTHGNIPPTSTTYPGSDNFMIEYTPKHRKPLPCFAAKMINTTVHIFRIYAKCKFNISFTIINFDNC